MRPKPAKAPGDGNGCYMLLGVSVCVCHAGKVNCGGAVCKCGSLCFYWSIKVNNTGCQFETSQGTACVVLRPPKVCVCARVGTCMCGAYTLD